MKSSDEAYRCFLHNLLLEVCMLSKLTFISELEMLPSLAHWLLMTAFTDFPKTSEDVDKFSVNLVVNSVVSRFY